jgi:hypothetical protein
MRTANEMTHDVVNWDSFSLLNFLLLCYLFSRLGLDSVRGTDSWLKLGGQEVYFVKGQQQRIVHLFLLKGHAILQTRLPRKIYALGFTSNGIAFLLIWFLVLWSLAGWWFLHYRFFSVLTVYFVEPSVQALWERWNNCDDSWSVDATYSLRLFLFVAV